MKETLKNLNIYFFFLIITFNCSNIFSQNLTLIPNPDTINKISINQPTIYNNTMLFGYSKHIAKYDGANITLIPNPDNGAVGTSNIDRRHFGIIFNSEVYYTYRNENNKIQLAKYDGASITLIPNPDNGNVLGGIIVYKNSLYCFYRNASFIYCLLKYDGSNTSLITIPNNGRFIEDYYYYPIIYNDELFFCYNFPYNTDHKMLAKYDGVSIQTIPNPDSSNVGYQGWPVIYNNELYFSYKSLQNFHLAKYDGSSITLIPNLTNGQGGGCLTLFNNILYFGYGYDSLNTIFLSKYDGSKITIIPYPDNANGMGFYNFHNGSIKLVGLNNDLFFQYSTIGQFLQLAKYDGGKITLIPNLTSCSLGEQTPIVFCNKLFFTYANSVTDKRCLAYYDGSSIKLISNPDSGKVNIFNDYELFIFNNNLFTIYTHYSFGKMEYQWAKLSFTNDINEIKNNDCVNIYPNPAHDFININITDINSDYNLLIYDIKGKLLYTDKFYKNHSQIIINELPNGIYILKIISNKNVIVKKLIKE